MNDQYDNSWDLYEGDPGYSERCEDALEEKFEEWAEREWMSWLTRNLTFPFTVTREENFDEWGDEEESAPFQVGHKMQVIALAEEDEDMIVVKVQEKGQIGCVPLCDLEVTPKKDKNYWPVREYVVWFANR